MPRFRFFAALLATLTLSACGGGDNGTTPPTGPPVNPPGPPPVQPGMLALSASGLPDGTAPALSVSGPLPAATFQRSAAAAATWTDVPAGRYTVTVAPVRGVAGRFAGAPASFEVDVPAGGPVSQAAATYRPVPSALLVETEGVPNDAPSALTVTVPGSEAAPAAARTVLVAPQVASGANTPDQWRIAAGPVLHQGSRYTPQRVSIDTVVPFGDTARVRVPYSIATGSLAVVVNGLPDGLPGAVRVLRGDSVLETLTATHTVVGLEPGAYRLVALPVTRQQTTFRAITDTQVVEVAASAVAAPAAVRYAAQVGRLSVAVSGLPAGANAALQLTGNGLQQAITGAITLDSLPEGTYQLSAAPVTVNDERFGPTPITQTVRITTGAHTTAAVQHAMIPTVVDIPVSGLPGNVPANVTVVGPDGELYTVTESRRVFPARPGRWRLSASGVIHALGNFTAAPATRDTVVSPGDTLRLPVQYTITTGSLAVAIVGLPGGAVGSIAVNGPGGFARLLTSTTTLTGLAPGNYVVSASAVVFGGVTYLPNTPSQTVNVTAGLSATPATVGYAGGFGALAIAATGVPPGSTPVFVLTSTGQNSRVVNGAGTVSGLAATVWTVTPQPITTGTATYVPTPSVLQATVPAGSLTSVSFAYAPTGGEGGGGSGPNFRIAHVHLTQAVQRLDGSVPLVANRDALLRVFVTAAQANTARPDVRVRLYDGPTLLQTTTIPAPEPAVRTTIAEGVLGSTWNMVVPASNMRTNLRIQVELDPTQAVPDSNRTDNVWPLNGTQAITVSNVPAFAVRFVPIVVGALTGNVSEANKEQYLVSARRLFPLRDVLSDVRAPFTSTATELQSGDTNGQWLTVLSEINALRTADGAPLTTHYYGVLKVNYTSGIAGYGYVPGRAAIGWDHLPSGDLVAAHEWGHNFSRPHAPCGVAGELTYPYPGGIIGQWGWNSTTGLLVSPTATDLMGYCNNNWISDYTWNAVMQYRSFTGVTSAALAARQGSPDSPVTPGEGLLVWGRVRNGEILLEPAFRVRAPVTRLTGTASHRVDLLDQGGTTILSTPLETSVVDHVTGGDERQFAVVMPWSATLEQRLSALRVQDVRVPTRSVVRRSPRPTVAVDDALAPSASVEIAAGRAAVRWAPGDATMALVTDAATGQIMGFVRRPGDAVTTGGRAVQVQLSDGVRSRTVR